MWQTIDSAPKDGTHILACRMWFIPQIVKWVDHDGLAKWSIDPEHFMEEEHFHEYHIGTRYEPTHWMPLPEGPK